MTVFRRTREGFLSRCPLCGAATKIELGEADLGAPCPACGQLPWLSTKVSRDWRRGFSEYGGMSGGTTDKAMLPQAPQFGISLLLVLLSTCALAFAMLGAQLHVYLDVSALMVLMFWMGAALNFVGLALDGQGDVWLAPAALAESIGLGLVVIAVFTGAYYGAMFILATFAMAL